MYKSKLQEYCQRKAWRLPEYSTARDGKDHCPQFKASVVVNGSTFTTPDFSRSSKEAQNLVAKLAFDHFNGSLGASVTSLSATTSSGLEPPKATETEQASSLSTSNTESRDDKKLKDMAHLCKNQLQIYAQKRNLDLPVYISEREGPPHAPRFKSKVVLGGQTYESQEFFSTIKDAENAAARTAIMSVSPGGIGQDDPSFFKNLLQELAQKEYSCLPEYNTSRHGPSHSPVFISTVQIKEESFIGQEAKTKKLAEIHAAKVAYTALTERKSRRSSEPDESRSHVDFTSSCSTPKLQSTVVAELPQKNIAVPHSVANDASKEQGELTKGADHTGSKSKRVEVKPEGCSNQNNCGHKVGGQEGSTYTPNAPQSASIAIPAEVLHVPCDSSYTPSSHKKIKVYPRSENVPLPPGATIMHQDERWIAVTTD